MSDTSHLCSPAPHDTPRQLLPTAEIGAGLRGLLAWQHCAEAALHARGLTVSVQLAVNIISSSARAIGVWSCTGTLPGDMRTAHLQEEARLGGQAVQGLGVQPARGPPRPARLQLGQPLHD